MQQLGNTDPAFTLRVYSHLMRRSDQERDGLKALVEGQVCREKAGNGSFRPSGPPRPLLTNRKALP